MLKGDMTFCEEKRQVRLLGILLHFSLFWKELCYLKYLFDTSGSPCESVNSYLTPVAPPVSQLIVI